MGQLVFDEKVVEQLEVLYRSRDVLRRRKLVYDALGAVPGERILDVGCGPGFYTRELLDQVDPDGAVAGVDSSPQMLAVAERRCEGRENVTFHEGDATALPVDSESFDRALCVQVLEYVEDAAATLTEMHRALRPGGRVVIWDVDWATVSWHTEDPERMARILAAWDEHLAHPSLPRTLSGSLRAAGFEDVRMDAHAFATAELTMESYGGAALPVIERYVAGEGADEVEAWAGEQRELGERGEFYFACMQFCFSATRP
ncbi:MAG: methyltransferase domain-containing protein [Thermoleophilaceae bacterium]